MNKNVLIIVRDFIPYFPSLGGVIRMLKLAEYLSKKGINVTILCAKGKPISFFGYEELISKLNIVYLEDSLQYYYTSSILNTNQDNGKHKQGLRKFLVIIKRILDEVSIPDKGIFFIFKFYKQALYLIKKHNISSIIVSSPPHSTQIIGFMLKLILKNKIRYIIDYRDGWNTLRIFKKNFKILSIISKYLEKRILSEADHILCVSYPLQRKISQHILDIQSKSTVVMNGYDLDMKEIIQNENLNFKRDSILNISYFGAINDYKSSFRNPTNFLQILEKFNKPICLKMFGSIQINEKWSFALGKKIGLFGNLAHDKALVEMTKADLLVIFHSQIEDADEVIPGKIFEYILAEKPILAIGPDNFAAAQMVKEYHLGYVMNILDPSDMLSRLEQIYSDWEAGKLVSYQSSETFSRQFQYEKIVKLLLSGAD